jgi:hypothetical protein
MPPRLADRLRECLEVFHAGVTVPKALIEDAAAELDRREALVTAAEALQQKIQIYTDSDDNFDTGELPHLADVMSAARDVVAVLKGSHAH